MSDEAFANSAQSTIGRHSLCLYLSIYLFLCMHVYDTENGFSLFGGIPSELGLLAELTWISIGELAYSEKCKLQISSLGLNKWNFFVTDFDSILNI